MDRSLPEKVFNREVYSNNKSGVLCFKHTLRQAVIYVTFAGKLSPPGNGCGCGIATHLFLKSSATTRTLPWERTNVSSALEVKGNSGMSSDILSARDAGAINAVGSSILVPKPMRRGTTPASGRTGTLATSWLSSRLSWSSCRLLRRASAASALLSRAR